MEEYSSSERSKRPDLPKLPETQEKSFEEIVTDPQPGDELIYDDLNNGEPNGNHKNFAIVARDVDILLVATSDGYLGRYYNQEVKTFQSVQKANQNFDDLRLKKCGKYLDPKAWGLAQDKAKQWLEARK